MSYFVFPTFTLFSQRPSERAQSGESERHATVTGGMEIGLRDNCSSQTARVRLSSPKKLTVLQRISFYLGLHKGRTYIKTVSHRCRCHGYPRMERVHWKTRTENERRQRQVHREGECIRSTLGRCCAVALGNCPSNLSRNFVATQVVPKFAKCTTPRQQLVSKCCCCHNRCRK